MLDHFADLEDDLGGDPFAGMGGLAGDHLETRPASSANTFTTTCIRCGGTGRFRPTGGECFTCKGKGTQTFRTSFADRQKAKASRVRTAERKVDAWSEANPVEAAWIIAKAPTFGFAASMAEALREYGSLTERQTAAVAKCAAQDAERAVTRAAERAERETTAKAVNVDVVEAAFTKALEAGKKSPRLRLDTFVLSPAKATGKNPGAIYVKEGETYLGKITGGKFQRSFSCDAVTEARVVAVAADPKGAAISYGRAMGSCSCCGRTLTDPVSIEMGIGPVCASSYGW